MLEKREQGSLDGKHVSNGTVIKTKKQNLKAGMEFFCVGSRILVMFKLFPSPKY